MSDAWLEIREGRLGRGVFAARAFAKGEVVKDCPTLEVADADVTGTLSDYVFGSGEEGEVLLLLGYGMLYNHAADPNLEYVQYEPGVISFVTARPVEAGEELTIDYGGEWWRGRGREPAGRRDRISVDFSGAAGRLTRRRPPRARTR